VHRRNVLRRLVHAVPVSLRRGQVIP
jgi:hypothetical protein